MFLRFSASVIKRSSYFANSSVLSSIVDMQGFQKGCFVETELLRQRFYLPLQEFCVVLTDFVQLLENLIAVEKGRGVCC